MLPAARSRTPQFAEPLQPVERYVPLAFKLGVYAFLALFFSQALEVFAEYRPGVPWPRLLWVFRMFTFLPLHEGGHFLFILFGRTLYILGGSFWQIMFPLLWFIIAFRQGSQVAPFPLFWVGENMMDVSLYIRDAPTRMIPLLGGDKAGHDWHNLLGQWHMLDAAGTIADVMFVLGILICIAAIGAGVGWAILVFVQSGRPKPLLAPVRNDAIVEDRLHDELKKEEDGNTIEP